MKIRLKLSAVYVALGLTLITNSDHVYAKTPWSALSPQQQELLEQVRPKWSSMSATQQDRLLRMSQRYVQKDASKQAVMRERIGNWSELTPEERAEARRNYKAFSQESIKRGERNSNWNSYQNLPTQQRLLGTSEFDKQPLSNAGNALAPSRNASSYPVTPLGSTPKPLPQVQR